MERKQLNTLSNTVSSKADGPPLTYKIPQVPRTLKVLSPQPPPNKSSPSSNETFSLISKVRTIFEK